MRPAIDTIARTCGVSRTTVSRVLNKHPYVKDDIRERVLATIKELDYVPQQRAVRKKLAVLAVEGLGKCMGFYEASIVSLTTTALMQRGLGVRIYPAEDFNPLEEPETKCVIYTCPYPNVPKPLPPDIQGIVINSVVDGFHSVRSDHEQGMRLAVEKLAAMGHKRIGLLLGELDDWGNRMRLASFNKSIAELELDAHPQLIQRQGEHIMMLEAMSKLMQAAPTAVVVSGEGACLDANHALHVLGRKIPDDISLVTMEHPAISGKLTPPNTTVKQDFNALAEAAAEMAAKIVEGGMDGGSREAVFKCTFIERESTRSA